MAKPPSSPTPQPDGLGEQPYLPGDPIPAADAVEKNTETTWKLFEELNAKQDMRYADTVPAGTVERQPPASAQPMIRPALRAASITLEAVFLEATRANRVCPKPEQWESLYRLLTAAPNQQSEVAAPLLGVAWADTPSLAKRMCLKDQIQWAAAHGLTDSTYRYLKGLPEDQWHHMGE